MSENETVTLWCDVCSDRIINPARSWPRAAEVPQEPVYLDGQPIREAHLGCYRLARGVQEAKHRPMSLEPFDDTN